ncbi:hypothetical protein BU14_0499s0001 [Porphyra umbilicalis]|uniref:Uncharacterized protein n=1 Tax=Porphyra umbilicalis TaxID=2786 RepID=A0A1X6NT58_PORUM|nr:hypothetical protein BU14_0499s0001 [Porphyra umbilicalis]|eukprot:OSX71819.1 hypothetical protein BU14_0499s0001 [Porphyra umbilicalis]
MAFATPFTGAAVAARPTAATGVVCRTPPMAAAKPSAGAAAAALAAAALLAVGAPALAAGPPVKSPTIQSDVPLAKAREFPRGNTLAEHLKPTVTAEGKVLGGLTPTGSTTGAAKAITDKTPGVGAITPGQKKK